MSVAGVVLCGGASRRMGADKAWLQWAGEPLLVSVVRGVSEVASPVVVVAGVDQPIPPLPGATIVVRDESPGLGPLAGLRTGLRRLDEPDRIILAGVDAPRLDADTLRWLLQAPAVSAGVARVNGVHQTLPCVLPGRGLGRAVESLLAEGRRSLRSLIQSLPCDVRADPPNPDAFAPCNTPAEFGRLTGPG
jgi:molybdopterin-guanine dinucleotide biosynthesis protein A